jgi:hypothetical protein
MSKTNKRKAKDANYKPEGRLDPRDYEIDESTEDNKKTKGNNGETKVPKTQPKIVHTSNFSFLITKGRPTDREIYQFKQRDLDSLVQGLKIYGNQHAIILKEYFSDQPEVTRQDIANVIKKYPYLQDIAKSSMKLLIAKLISV